MGDGDPLIPVADTGIENADHDDIPYEGYLTPVSVSAVELEGDFMGLEVTGEVWDGLHGGIEGYGEARRVLRGLSLIHI